MSAPLAGGRAKSDDAPLEPMEATESYEGRSGTFGALALGVVRAGLGLRELRLAHTDLMRHPDDDAPPAGAPPPGAALHATLALAGYASRGSGRRSVRTVADLCEALRLDSGLESADLRATRLGDSGCRVVAKLLADLAGPPLLRLELAENELSDVAAGELCRSLRLNSSLAHLGLESNRIGVAGARAIAGVLALSQSLLSLSLDDNPSLGALGVAALAEAVPDASHLVTLSLQRCGAGRGGSTLALRALTRALGAPLPPSLRELRLGGNGFGPESRAALWAALASSGQLVDLGIARGT